MKVRAVAIASERSNAIGALELECTPHGLVIVNLGIGSFTEGYAPGALTSGTKGRRSRSIRGMARAPMRVSPTRSSQSQPPAM